MENPPDPGTSKPEPSSSESTEQSSSTTDHHIPRKILVAGGSIFFGYCGRRRHAAGHQSGRSLFPHARPADDQDCIVEHHDLVVALADAIPQCAILGDPLQGIFDFGDSTLVDWPSHVHPRFPIYAHEHSPWRWTGHNEELGQWLIDIRPLMVAGGTLDLSKVNVRGLEWKQAGVQSEIQSAYDVANQGGSVVLLHQVRNQHRTVGRAAKGMYSIMETLRGDYMHEELRKLEQLGPGGYAKWLAETAKDCFSGLSTIDATVIGRLDKNKSLVGLKRPALPATMAILESVREQPP